MGFVSSTRCERRSSFGSFQEGLSDIIFMVITIELDRLSVEFIGYLPVCALYPDQLPIPERASAGVR